MFGKDLIKSFPVVSMLFLLLNVMIVTERLKGLAVIGLFLRPHKDKNMEVRDCQKDIFGFQTFLSD